MFIYSCFDAVGKTVSYCVHTTDAVSANLCWILNLSTLWKSYKIYNFAGLP